MQIVNRRRTGLLALLAAVNGIMASMLLSGTAVAASCPTWSGCEFSSPNCIQSITNTICAAHVPPGCSISQAICLGLVCGNGELGYLCTYKSN
jgi:hypothetical protein